MKSAIVTGATGFIGAHLVDELVAKNVNVTALCRYGSANLGRLPGSVDIVYDPLLLPKADVFYHLAWDGASGAGRADAGLQAGNAQMTLDTLIAAERKGCDRFIGLGTVYENFADRIKTSADCGGADFYILSKEYAHSCADQLAKKLGIGFIWCTVCHPIGRYIKPEQMMAFFISSMLKGSKPSFGPASTLFDIVAVEDVARGLYALGERENLSKRCYYIGSGAPKPLSAWLYETRKILGASTPIGIGERSDDGLRFEEQWFDIKPIMDDAGYKPTVSLTESVNNVADWMSATL